jgi:hypothetical protein
MSRDLAPDGSTTVARDGGLFRPNCISDCATTPAAGTALLLAVGSDSERRSVGRTLSHPVLQWVGRHSYGWYWWHWPLRYRRVGDSAGGLVTR